MSGRGEGLGWSLLLDVAPAAMFGCAAAFAAAAAVGATLASELPLIAGVVAGCAAWFLLRRFGNSPFDFAMQPFEGPALGHEAAIEVRDDDELLLDDVPLDDVLAQPEPGSRVVCLFGRQPVVRSCSPAQARVNLQLRSVVRPIPTPPDATEALHEALASLRQSLR